LSREGPIGVITLVPRAWKVVIVEVWLVVLLVLCSLDFTIAADSIFASTPPFPH